MIISCIPISIGQDMPLVILSNVELVTVDENTAVITWVSNPPADTGVQWGETEALGDEIILEEATTYHFIKIDTLEDGTQYYYRVGSGNSWSDIDTFTTLQPMDDNLKFQFAVVADTHYDADGQNTPNGYMYGDSVQILDSLVDELNLVDDLDFVMTVGDLTNGAQEEDFSGFVMSMNELDMNWYPLLGNHDKTSIDWYDHYKKYIGFESTYYSFDYKDYQFVILDSAVQGLVKGDLNETQLSWLESDLDNNSGKPTMIFMHHVNHRTDINGVDEEAKDNLDQILSTRPWVLSVNSGHSHQNYFTEGDYGQSFVTVAATVSYPIGYSIIKVYGYGYTEAFHKIQAELEVSEESRRRINAASGRPNEDDVYLGEIKDRSIVVEIPDNNPPIISSITAEPGTVEPGGTSSITVTATDPEEDSLTYIFNTNDGWIEGSHSIATYHAPDYTGVFTVFVSVSDGEFTSIEKSIDIEVRDTETNNAPSIKKIWNSKSTVEPNEVIEIKVTAIDADNDKITYHYQVFGGTLTGSGDEVKWVAPDKVGEYTITIWVSDWETESNRDTITITVTEQQKTETGWVPGFEFVWLIVGCLFILSIYVKKRKY
jgi:hypothetical protein